MDPENKISRIFTIPPRLIRQAGKKRNLPYSGTVQKNMALKLDQ